LVTEVEPHPQPLPVYGEGGNTPSSPLEEKRGVFPPPLLQRRGGLGG